VRPWEGAVGDRCRHALARRICLDGLKTGPGSHFPWAYDGPSCRTAEEAPSLRRGGLFLRKGSYRRAYHEPRLCAHFVRAPPVQEFALARHAALRTWRTGRSTRVGPRRSPRFQALLVASRPLWPSGDRRSPTARYRRAIADIAAAFDRRRTLTLTFHAAIPGLLRMVTSRSIVNRSSFTRRIRGEIGGGKRRSFSWAARTVQFPPIEGDDDLGCQDCFHLFDIGVGGAEDRGKHCRCRGRVRVFFSSQRLLQPLESIVNEIDLVFGCRDSCP